MIAKSLLIAGSVGMFSLSILNKCNDDAETPYECPAEPTAEIIDSFAKFTPIAKSVHLKLHNVDSCKESGNVKLFVSYDKSEFNLPTLAIKHEGKKVVLRDDGVYPDFTASDGEYTVIVNMDTANLRNLYTNDVSLLKGAGKIAAMSFKNREIISNGEISTNDLQTRLDFAAFVAGNKVAVTSSNIIPENIRNRATYIIDTKVVESLDHTWNPKTQKGNVNGAWTFGKVMEGLANSAETKVDVSDFTMNWLKTWMNKQTVNGDELDSRTLIKNKVIDPWLTKSGGQKLDMKFAPFKLLAIVNRLDLMENQSFTKGEQGGEFRLVFEVLNAPLTGGEQFVIIFEFGVNKSGADLTSYANEWIALSKLKVGDKDYNDQLKKISDQIILPGKNSNKPNGSNLNQLRTNEIALGAWQIREFNIDATTHLLKNVTVKQEPASSKNQSAQFISFMNKHATKISQNRYTVPEKFENDFFLGAKSDYPNSGIWNATGVTDKRAIFVFSLNTCSGCHLEVTNTPFLHNRQVPFGQETQLSGFVAGVANQGLGDVNSVFEVPEPNNNTVKHKFNDLSRRANFVWEFTNSHPTLFSLLHDPVKMVD